MTDYELIRKVFELEERIKELEKSQFCNIAFTILTIMCGVCLIGCIICTIITCKER